MINKKQKSKKHKQEIIVSKQSPNMLNNLTELGQKFLENQNAELAQRERDNQRNYSLSSKNLYIEKLKIHYTMIIFGSVIGSLIFIAIGLVFFKNETSNGLLVLSHSLVSILSFFAGKVIAKR